MRNGIKEGTRLLFCLLFGVLAVVPSWAQESSNSGNQEKYKILNQDWSNWDAYKEGLDPWYFQENLVLVSACTIHLKNNSPEGEFFKQGDRYYVFLAGSGGGVFFESMSEYQNQEYKMTVDTGVSFLAPVTFLPIFGINKERNGFFLGSLGEGWALPAAKIAFEELVNNHFSIISEIDVDFLHELSEKKVCSVEKIDLSEYQKRFEKIILDENFVNGIEIPFKDFLNEVD